MIADATYPASLEPRSRPTARLSHGTTSLHRQIVVDSRVVGHQVAFLARHVRVLTYDPRGAGLSDRPSTGYRFEKHSDDARAVLDEKGRVIAPTFVIRSR